MRPFDLFSKCLFVFAAITANYNLGVDCVYCFVCTSASPSCGTDRSNLEPCNGECVVYLNPNSGLLTRTCSWYINVMERQGDTTSVVNGISMTFCTGDACNTGGAVVVNTTPTVAPTAGTGGPATTTGKCSKACENGGNQNAACECVCLPLYSGTFCEIVNCDAQYPFCDTDFTAADCGQVEIQLMCPKLCNPKCQAGATTTVATTVAVTTLPGTTIAGCPGVVCQSGSVIDPKTCKCQCIPGTSGDFCEILDCNAPDNAACSALDCNDDPDIKYFCIQKCKTCASTPTTAAPTTTTTTAATTVVITTQAGTTNAACPGVVCQSASTLDIASCKCQCLPGTSGQFCQILDCNQPDNPACGALACDDDPDIPYFCIQKCKTCSSTVATTAAATTTTTAAGTTNKACPGVVCKSASNLDIATCTCQCLPGTSGTSCEIINCAQPDNPACGVLACDDDPDIPYFCIQKCNTCGSTVPPVTTAATTTTTTTPTTTTTTATTTTTTVGPCDGKICLSAGTLDVATCKCSCLPGFFGTNCELIKCTQPDDSMCSLLNCASPDVKYYCIQKCNTCAGQTGIGTVGTAAPVTTTTTVSTASTTEVCDYLDCKYGGQAVLDPVKGCYCSCLENFYGPTCATFNTTVLSSIFDPLECNDVDCDFLGPDSEIAGYCPVKCIFCGGKACDNAGLLKYGTSPANRCQCECLPEFTGDRCQDKIAKCTDDDACGSQFPVAACDEPFIEALCPKMCKVSGC